PVEVAPGGWVIDASSSRTADHSAPKTALLANSRGPTSGLACGMIEIPRHAPASVTCGRSGLPLLPVCSLCHRRLVPFRLLKTQDDDTSQKILFIEFEAVR